MPTMRNVSMRRRKRGMPIVPVIAAAVVAYLVFSDGEQSPTTPVATAPPSGTQAPPSAASPSSYAANPLLNNWPELEAEGNAFTLPEDLLAANYYVVLDASGSMNERECSQGSTKMQVAVKALADFANSVPADANFGLAVFHRGKLTELLPLGRERHDLAGLISRIHAEGGTPLYESVRFAYQKLFEQGKRQLGYGEYHLVMVTDGRASAGQDPTPAVNRMFDQAPIALHTIGFCIRSQHSLNQPGRTVYRSANDPESLKKGLGDVLAEAPVFDVADFSE